MIQSGEAKHDNRAVFLLILLLLNQRQTSDCLLSHKIILCPDNQLQEWSGHWIWNLFNLYEQKSLCVSAKATTRVRTRIVTWNRMQPVIQACLCFLLSSMSSFMLCVVFTSCSHVPSSLWSHESSGLEDQILDQWWDGIFLCAGGVTVWSTLLICQFFYLHVWGLTNKKT